MVIAWAVGGQQVHRCVTCSVNGSLRDSSDGWRSGQRLSATDDTELAVVWPNLPDLGGAFGFLLYHPQSNARAYSSSLGRSTPLLTRPLPLDLPHNIRLPNSYSFLPNCNHNHILLSQSNSHSLSTHSLHMLPH